MSKLLLGLFVLFAVIARLILGEDFELSSVDWAIIASISVGAIITAIEGCARDDE